jgi:hypothetical protein
MEFTYQFFHCYSTKGPGRLVLAQSVAVGSSSSDCGRAKDQNIPDARIATTIPKLIELGKWKSKAAPISFSETNTRRIITALSSAQNLFCAATSRKYRLLKPAAAQRLAVIIK